MPPRPPCCCLSAYHPQSQRPARWKPGYLRGLSTPSRLSRQGQQHSLKELVGFLVVLGDVSILMEPKYFRVCCDREGPEVLNVGLKRKSSIGIRAGPLGSRRWLCMAKPISKRNHVISVALPSLPSQDGWANPGLFLLYGESQSRQAWAFSSHLWPISVPKWLTLQLHRSEIGS